MALSFLNWFRRREPTQPAALPDGLRVYAVGDVHGRLDRLLAIDAAIREDVAGRPPAGEAIVIMLGDYVDRGPDSKGVVEWLTARTVGGLPARLLIGNHEEALLRFLEEPASGGAWLSFGGMATLASYAVKAPPEGADKLRHLGEELNAKLPATHLDFFRALELHIELGDFLFVHAGVRPGRPLDRQTRHDLLNIREPFLSARNLPWRVVHGHTVLDDVHFGPTRISLDTGAYATGRLSCAVIEGSGATLLTQ